MNANEILQRLKELSDPKRIAGQKRAGIDISKALGVKVPLIRQLAKEIGKDHILALEVYKLDFNECKMLASIIDDPKLVTEQQMDDWVVEFNSWDVCDTVISDLFEKTPYAGKKALEWKDSPKTFIKRAGFVLMAQMGLKRNKDSNQDIEAMFPHLIAGATDERNFVKKAVNWALRQIGKKNLYLNKKAVETAQVISKMDSSSARWIAADALRELTSEKMLQRLTDSEKK